MPSFEDLPFEILSEILTIAAELNASEAVSYTYGLSQAPRSLQRVPIQKYIRGRVPHDLHRWNLVNSFRLVNSRWHEWALSFALKEIYVRRWRGGEQWANETEAFKEQKDATYIHPVVYQDPYKSVKSTAKLFMDYPQIAGYIRRIWFNGIYQFDTNKYIFQILHNIVNVQTVAIPWTALRYGGQEEWQRLISFPQLTSLEFLSVSLGNSQAKVEKNLTNNSALIAGSGLDFSGLKRFKIFGDSNLMPLTDEDLLVISHTAVNLEEIHITGTNSVTIKGVAALVAASSQKLKLLQFTPLSDDGFKHPSSDVDPQVHICTLLASCPCLKDLAVTVPTCCPELFSCAAIQWHETVRIRIAGHGTCHPSDRIDTEELTDILESARGLVGPKARKGKAELDIEIAVGNFLFEAKTGFVHGNYREAKKLSEMTWDPEEFPTTKGPYGHTGLYGNSDNIKGEWSCIPEHDFFDAMRWGLVKFDN